MQQTPDLIEELSKHKNSAEIEDFIKKYKTWFAFFDEVLKIPEENVLPKIHALVATTKITILIGLAESLGVGNSSVTRYKSFLQFLTIEEKLLFCLIFKIKFSSNREAEKLHEQYLKTQDENFIEKLLAISTKSDDLYHNEVNEIMKAFLNGDITKLDSYFKRRADLFYGVRSKIVHNGSPDVIGAMLNSGMEVLMYYGEKDNKFFTINYPIEEFFIRAAYRIAGHEPPKIQLKDYLWKNFIHRHAPFVAKIINKTSIEK